MYRFSVITIKTTVTFFTDRKKVLKFIWSHKSKLEQKEQSWRHHTAWHQNILQSCQNQKQNIDQCNRMESPETNPWTDDQLVSNEGPKNTQLLKIAFSKWCWNIWIVTYRSMKLDPCLISYTKSNSEWVRELSWDCKTIGRKCEKHHNIGLTMIFFKKHKQQKQKWKMGLYQTKKLL
jgi:hypothetical protein